MFLSSILGIPKPPGAGFHFDTTATGAIIGFEAFTIVFTIVSLFCFNRLVSKAIVRFLLVSLGILIFEFFTSPMWHNYHMGSWAYLYQDVSWILTIGWATVILWVMIFVDRLKPLWSELRRFILYLVVLTVLVFFLEVIVIHLGIRSYAPEVLRATCGVMIFGVPIEWLYYAPVFLALVISFFKYGMLIVNQVPLPPVKKIPWLRTFVITFIGVLLFELMINPIVENKNLPAWSYIYGDINWLMTGVWIVLLWLTVNIVERWFIHWDTLSLYFLSLFIIALLATPVEAFYITHGFRVYGQSAVENFSGFQFPGTNIPAEVVFAIPFYFALVIPFIRYFSLVFSGGTYLRFIQNDRRSP